MADIRLVGARKLVCDKDAWREPGTVAFYTRLMQKIIDEEGDPIDRAEAGYLIKKLYAATKRPPLA